MNKENLVRISANCGEYSVSLKVPREIFYVSGNAEKLLDALKICLDAITNDEMEIQPPKVLFEENIKRITEESFKQSPVPYNDSFKIRERIPNNVVDVKELDIKQAVTENALVRCPHCGQAHVLAVNSGNCIYMMRRFYSQTGADDEFRIIAEFDSANTKGLFNMSCKPETDRKAYFEDIQKIKMTDDKDFAVTNETEVFCPVCCQSESFFNWKNAYENPLEYFETEHLCDVCGGETITKMVKEQKVNKCEKCGHETEYTEE